MENAQDEQGRKELRLKFLKKFKKKEKKEKELKPKTVTKKKANTIVSGFIFLLIAIVLTGTIRNFTAVGEVERLQSEVALLQQERRANTGIDGNIDLPLVMRFLDEFVPLFVNVDFSQRELVEERFEELSEYFAFSHEQMFAIGSQMSRTLESSELLSARSYQNFNLAQIRVTYTLEEKRLVNSEHEDEHGEYQEQEVEHDEQAETLPNPVVEETQEEERVEADYREELAEQLQETSVDVEEVGGEVVIAPEQETDQEDIQEADSEDLEPVAEPEPVIEPEHEPVVEAEPQEQIDEESTEEVEQPEIETISKEVTTVLNIPFIQEENQITIISQPYFTGESDIIGRVQPFTRMESSDSSQEMILARESIESYLPIFFTTYADSDPVALSLLMEEVVLMGGDFAFIEVDVSQARYRFVGNHVLVQVEVIFGDRETSFTHREPFTLLLEEQANSWFVLEMHHLFIE